MNDVYACLVIAKEAAMTLFFIACIIAVVKAFVLKDKKEKNEKVDGE